MFCCRVASLRTCLMLLAASLPAVTAKAVEVSTRPNVLFLFADDMRADSIAALGDSRIITPHLDRLVERGFAFRNAYCLGSSQPAVCNPSRNMLLSGNAYFRWQTGERKPGEKGSVTSRLAPADGANFPRQMNAAGYITWHYGKRGNTAPLIQELFQVNKYLPNDEAERRSGEPGKLIVDEAIEFLEQDRQGQPFCMYLAFANPHDPRVAADSYRRQYQQEQLTLPDNFLPVHPFNNGEMTVRDEMLSPWPRTKADILGTWHDYYATITALDHHIGRLLQRLDDLKLTGNTIIVFSADHGIAIGSHGLLGKQNLYDHSMKAPLVFAGPGISHGSSEALVYLLDIYPTICDLAGVPAGNDRDGRSAAAVIRGVQSTHRQELLLAYRNVQRACRNDRWKLIRYPQVDVTQLFDLVQDPGERENLADRPEQQQRVADMRTSLQRLQEELGDRLPWTADQTQPREWAPPRRDNTGVR